jgi:general secretion pathway protein D
MKSSMLRKALVVCGLMGMSLMAQFALAQDTALSKNVTLYLRDADLLSATRQLTQLTGLNFTFLPSEKPFAKINLSLENVSAEDAIRYICQAAGAHAERDERGIFIIRSGEAREVQSVSSAAPASEKLIVREIEIRKADPRDVMDMLIYGYVMDPERLSNDMWSARQRISDGISSSSGMPGYSKATTFDPGASNSPIPNDQGLRLPNVDNGQRAGGAGGGGGQPGGLGGGGGQPGGGGLGGGGQAGGGGSFAGATGGQGLIPEGTHQPDIQPGNQRAHLPWHEPGLPRIAWNPAAHRQGSEASCRQSRVHHDQPKLRPIPRYRLDLRARRYLRR